MLTLNTQDSNKFWQWNAQRLLPEAASGKAMNGVLLLLASSIKLSCNTTPQFKLCECAADPKKKAISVLFGSVFNFCVP